MATFDQLSAEQKAILELVLKRGRSYDQLADTLGMSEARVRDLARDALVDLAPLSARRVEQDWRGQLADYVLGQQTGPESTATRGHLRRSEAARTWTRSLLDSLDGLYEDGNLPAIPDPERGRERRREPREPRAAGLALPADVRRRRLYLGGGALALLILLAVLLWPIGVLTGGDDGGGGTSQASSAPINTQARGSAQIIRQGSTLAVQITAQGLPQLSGQQAYVAWLYNSQQDVKPIGPVPSAGSGAIGGLGRLPADYEKFKFIDISRQAASTGNRHSGDSVLRGLVKKLNKPVTRGKGKNAVSLLANIPLVPLPAGGGGSTG